MTQLDLLPVDVRPLPAPGDLCWFRQDGRAVDGMRRLPARSVAASVRELGGAHVV